MSNKKYKDKLTENFALGKTVKQFQSIKDQANRKLDQLESVRDKKDLALIPGNRFQALSGKRKGQFSIRINDQWRICFEWPENHYEAFNIEIVDYH